MSSPPRSAGAILLAPDRRSNCALARNWSGAAWPFCSRGMVRCCARRRQDGALRASSTRPISATMSNRSCSICRSSNCAPNSATICAPTAAGAAGHPAGPLQALPTAMVGRSADHDLCATRRLSSPPNSEGDRSSPAQTRGARLGVIPAGVAGRSGRPARRSLASTVADPFVGRPRIERPTTWRNSSCCGSATWMVDLRYQLPFDLRELAAPPDLAARRLADRADLPVSPAGLLRRVRPTATIMEQFAISVRSLIEFGRYQGQIVRVDRPFAGRTRTSCCRAEYLARITVIPFKPDDRPGFMAARYLMLDWPDGCALPARCSTSIRTSYSTATLRRCCMPSPRRTGSRRLSSPYSPLAPQCSPSGAALLQRDFCSPGYLAGFNTGTAGNPEFPCTCRDLAADPPDHRQPQLCCTGAARCPAPTRRSRTTSSFRLAQFRYRPDIALRPVSAAMTPHRASVAGLVHFWPVPVRPPEQRRCEIIWRG